MVCESMLPDAVDGALSAAEMRAFDTHVAGCVECARELEDARRGAAWLGMLKAQAPEPPATLLARILAETTSAQTMAQVVVAEEPVEYLPAAKPLTGFAAFRQKLRDIISVESARATFQPRFAMTAAMAFFSLAMTLNLAGVRLDDLHASSFTPGGMRRTVADASASATRSFQGLRVVYEVESKVSELRNEDGPVDPAARPSESHPSAGTRLSEQNFVPAR